MGLRDASIAILIVLGASAPPARHDLRAFAGAPRIDTSATLARVRDYVLTWQHAPAAVVAEERYTQTLTHYPNGRQVVSGRNKTTTRTLVSDVLLVHAPAENGVDSRFDERLTAEATYSNHRVFRTSTRILGGTAR